MTVPGRLSRRQYIRRSPGIGLRASAQLSQIPYSSDNSLIAEEVFPQGKLDADLQQVDRVVVLEVVDDGVGFDPAAVQERRGFGLRGMEERAARLGGKLTVQSSPGAGTTIKVEVAA